MDRRGDPGKPDTGERRRQREIAEREEDWRLLRDKILLIIGCVGVAGLTIAAVTVGVKDSGLALAALTVFGGLLGAPTILRLDERRRNGRNGRNKEEH